MDAGIEMLSTSLQVIQKSLFRLRKVRKIEIFAHKNRNTLADHQDKSLAMHTPVNTLCIMQLVKDANGMFYRSKRSRINFQDGKFDR